MVKAAGFLGGGWVPKPPVSQREAEKIFGSGISDAAWQKICKAFSEHGQRLDELGQTIDNKNPNDKQGWSYRKKSTEGNLLNAIKLLSAQGPQKTGGINRDFLYQVEQLVSLDISGGADTYNCAEMLDAALEKIEYVRLVVSQAKPLGREILTAAESRKVLAKDVYAALRTEGAKLSNGWQMELHDDPTLDDLTGFERLAYSLGIHTGETPKAQAKWLRDTLGTT